MNKGTLRAFGSRVPAGHSGLADVDPSVSPYADSMLSYDAVAGRYKPAWHPIFGPVPSTTGGAGNGIYPALVGYLTYTTDADEQNCWSGAIRISEPTAVNGVSFRVVTAVAGNFIAGMFYKAGTEDPTATAGWTLRHETASSVSVGTTGTKSLTGSSFSGATGNKEVLEPGWYRVGLYPTTDFSGVGFAAGYALPLLGQKRASGGSYPPSGNMVFREYATFGSPLTATPSLGTNSGTEASNLPWVGLYKTTI